MTPYAEVIGDPIAQSKSPVIHNFWLAKLGIEGEYRATRVSEGDLAAYLTERRGDPAWRGCNVTMPLKQAIVPLLDRIEPQARATGAVNTVIRAADGKLVGRNTDIDGFLEPLAPLLAARHYFRMARVLGTGGAARAVVTALAAHGFTIVLAGRDPDKARAILNELDPGREYHVATLDHFAEPIDFAFDDREGCCDLIVNATPLGMRGQPPLAFDWSHAPPGSIAYDIVTDPVETDFLRAARAAGHRTIDGVSMLMEQAALAFKRFIDMPPPRDCDAELRRLLL